MEDHFVGIDVTKMIARILFPKGFESPIFLY
jgi:hypothetical protein